MTTGTIAARLGTNSGPEPIIAAAARLTLQLGKAVFTRDELIAEMKTATAHFRATYVNNLSKDLNNLVRKGKLIERSRDVYARSVATVAEYVNALAEN